MLNISKFRHNMNRHSLACWRWANYLLVLVLVAIVALAIAGFYHNRYMGTIELQNHIFRKNNDARGPSTSTVGKDNASSRHTEEK